jgi:creatinine amidohydrolase
MKKVRSAEMSWREIEVAVKSGAAAIFPFGSTEEHGPHAPTGDFIVCEELAARVAQRTGDIVFPCMPFGYSEYFRHYAGTISLQHDTLFRVLEDVVTCLIDHGFEHIVLFNGHAGNTPTVGHLLRKIRREHGLLVPSVPAAGFATAAFKNEVYEGTPPRHGGAGQASDMMYLRPGTVQMELAGEWGVKDFLGLPVSGLSGVTFEGTEVAMAINMEDITPPTGSMSDPLLASAERGERVLKHTEERLVRFMEWFKSTNPRVNIG